MLDGSYTEIHKDIPIRNDPGRNECNEIEIRISIFRYNHSWRQEKLY